MADTTLFFPEKMCKEVDYEPKEEKTSESEKSVEEEIKGEEEVKKQVFSINEVEEKDIAKEAHEEEEKAEDVKQETLKEPTWIKPSLPVLSPPPSVYSMTTAGRNPDLLTSSDNETESTQVSEFKSVSSNSIDIKLDKLPLE